MDRVFQVIVILWFGSIIFAFYMFSRVEYDIKEDVPVVTSNVVDPSYLGDTVAPSRTLDVILVKIVLLSNVSGTWIVYHSWGKEGENYPIIFKGYGKKFILYYWDTFYGLTICFIPETPNCYANVRVEYVYGLRLAILSLSPAIFLTFAGYYYRKRINRLNEYTSIRRKPLKSRIRKEVLKYLVKVYPNAVTAYEISKRTGIKYNYVKEALIGGRYFSKALSLVEKGYAEMVIINGKKKFKATLKGLKSLNKLEYTNS